MLQWARLLLVRLRHRACLAWEGEEEAELFQLRGASLVHLLQA